MPPTVDRPTVARARARLLRAIRGWFELEGFDEVETPCLVPAPGMEPHIAAFVVPFVPEMAARSPHTLYLHTSPEYAMKRLLAEGFERIFQIARVFRNGEVAGLHNPEFSMLEFYRARADYHRIQDDLESIVRAAARAVTGREAIEADGGRVDLKGRFDRVTMRQALDNRIGIDLARCPTAALLAEAARRQGLASGPADAPYDEQVTRLFLDHVEASLGRTRPAFVTEYPASMAALARLKPGDPSVAERFELYVAGVELANGFSELNDAGEQRRRLVAEQAQRRAVGRPVYPLDERFLEAVGRMPEAAGVAVGLDRLLMVLVGARSVDEVLLFPAREFL